MIIQQGHQKRILNLTLRPSAVIQQILLLGAMHDVTVVTADVQLHERSKEQIQRGQLTSRRKTLTEKP